MVFLVVGNFAFMKTCTFCKQPAPDEATECQFCGHAVVDPIAPPPASATPVVTSQNMAHGILSLGSFIKLSVIAAIGCLPVLAVLYGLAFLFGLARSHHTASSADFPVLVLWPFLLLKVFYFAVTAVVSGFFAGLFGYPFYTWLCRRPGGVVLKGKFQVL